MSRPRAATSVATRKSISPALNASSAVGALRLVEVAVDVAGVQPDALHLAAQARDLALAVAEDDRLGDVLALDQPPQRLELLARRHDQQVVVDARRPWSPAAPPATSSGSVRKASARRRISAGMVAENISVWRRRLTRLTIRSTSGHEAHVEHAVGLVDDQDRDAAEQHLAALELVEQAAGRRDQHVHAAIQPAPLLVHADAADQQRHGEVEVLAVGLEVVRRSGSRARASGSGSASAACAPWPGRTRGARSSAARRRPSCRCRSGRCRAGRARPGSPGSRVPGSAWAP